MKKNVAHRQALDGLTAKDQHPFALACGDAQHDILAGILAMQSQATQSFGASSSAIWIIDDTMIVLYIFGSHHPQLPTIDTMPPLQSGSGSPSVTSRCVQARCQQPPFAMYVTDFAALHVEPLIN